MGSPFQKNKAHIEGINLNFNLKVEKNAEKNMAIRFSQATPNQVSIALQQILNNPPNLNFHMDEISAVEYDHEKPIEKCSDYLKSRRSQIKNSDTKKGEYIRKALRATLQIKNLNRKEDKPKKKKLNN